MPPVNVNLVISRNNVNTHYNATTDVLTDVNGTEFTLTTPAQTTELNALSGSSAVGRAILKASTAEAQRTSLGLGTAALASSSDFATAAQGAKSDTALQSVQASTISDATAPGRALLTSISSAAQRTALGLGTVATENTVDVVHTNGDETIAGVKTFTAIPKLTAVLATNTTATKMLVKGNGGAIEEMDVPSGGGSVTSASITDASAAGRTLLTAADSTAQRTALGLGTAATQANTSLVHVTGNETVAGVKTFTSAPVFSSTLATNTTATKMLVKSASGSLEEMAIPSGGGAVTSASITDATAAGRTLLTSADATAQRTALGLGTAATGTTVNTLISTSATDPLSANMGKQLNDVKLEAASLGGATAVSALKNYGLYGTATTPGNRLLVVGASTEKGFNASGNITSYVRSAGVVTIVVNSPNTALMVGQWCYLSHDTDGTVCLLAEIQSVSKSGNDYTATFADARANIASKNNVQFNWFGIASNHSTVVQLLNAATGGALDVFNFATGSTNTTAWLNVDRFTEIARHGPYDYGYFGFGIGNDLQNVGQGSAQTIVNRVFQCMDLYAKIVRRGVLVSPMGSASTAINPTVNIFTTMMLVENYLAREIPIRYPNFEFISTYKAALDLVNFGDTDTVNILNGRPPGELFETSAFIHYTPLGSEVIFKELVPFIKRHFTTTSRQSARSRVDNIFDNTVADPGGTMFNSGGLRPWMGTVPVTSVTVTGAGVIGDAPIGTTVTATNLKAGMTASISVQNHPLGGRKTVLNFNDPVSFTTAPTVTWRYSGGSTLIKDTLNNVNFQGTDCDFWVDLSFYGFNPNSIKFMDVGLIGVTSNGSTVICSPLSNLENDMGANNGRTWERGIGGTLRAPGKFKIPAGVYTDGYLQIYFGGINNTPMGSLTVEVSNIRLQRRLAA